MPHRLGLVAVLSFTALTLAFAQGSTPSQGTAPGGIPGQRAPTRTPTRAPGEAGPAVGTGVIRGFVVSLESGTPIRRAQVRLIGSDARQSKMASTDGLGRFEFRDLPPARYRLSASKGGLVSLQYGQRRPAQAGTPIELSDKQVLEKVIIGLPRGSVISGRITDEFGEPIASANVMVLQSRAVGGTRRWMGTGTSDRTDDLGQFRIYGLPPGEYLVSATFQMMGFEEDAGPDASGFAPTYFPGVANTGEAQRITLGLGEEHASASFPLIATHLVSVEGTVTSSEGGPITRGMVMLIQHDPSGQTAMSFMGGHNGRIDQHGRFKITNVPPGRYIAQARPMGPDNGEIARTLVTVGDEKVGNVALVMASGGRIRGRVVTDTGTPLPAEMQRVQVIAGQAGPGAAPMPSGGPATVQPDGTFELRGLVDPRVIRLFGAPGWILKSVMVSGRDYADAAIEVQPGQTLTGMEIVITNRVSTVSGMVTNERGQAVLDTTIVVFPDDQRLWQLASRHVKTTRPDQEGRYRVDGLPASDAYYAIAVQDYEEGQFTDPAYLAALRANATAFALREGETRVVDLRQK